MENFSELNRKIICCELCPRLVTFRKNVHPGEEGWRRPVPGFGDPNAFLLILGLAPSAQGGNRTGRIFTGDLSAKFLIETLFKAGLTNQPTSESGEDGLRLFGCYMTAIVKCVPPKNLPLPQERKNCARYLAQELNLLTSLKAVLALGKVAFDTYLRFVKQVEKVQEKHSFSHGVKCLFEKMPPLYGSYHPSPQNTHTKKLTQKMLLDLLHRIKKDTSIGGI